MAVSEQTLSHAAIWSGAPPVALSPCPSQPELLIKFLMWLQMLMNHFYRMVLQWGLVLLPPIKTVQGCGSKELYTGVEQQGAFLKLFRTVPSSMSMRGRAQMIYHFMSCFLAEENFLGYFSKGKATTKDEIKWEYDKMRNFIGRDSNITLSCLLSCLNQHLKHRMIISGHFHCIPILSETESQATHSYDLKETLLSS